MGAAEEGGLDRWWLEPVSSIRNSVVVANGTHPIGPIHDIAPNRNIVFEQFSGEGCST